MRRSGTTVSAELARIATAQHGVVTRAQLLDAGLSPAAIVRRRRAGALITVHPGVYRVGHSAPSTDATYLAAVLACGDGAVLSGMAAAHLHSLVRGRPPRPEVTARTERLIEGVTTRRARTFDPVDAVVIRGIRCTTVARTVVDLAGVLDLDALARVCHEADVLYRVTPAHVDAVLARRPNTAGAAKLRRVLHGEERVTLSALERQFLRLLRQNELPLPETNRHAGSKRVDCRWPDVRLTVELDGYRFHRSRHAWEQDHRREREARARGDDFRRFTYGDVFERPGPLLRELRAILVRAGFERGQPRE
jgi:very-short-patch-repair endonuclease